MSNNKSPLKELTNNQIKLFSGISDKSNKKNKPGSNTNKPGSNTNKPGSNTNKPGSNTNKPGSNTNKPGSNTNKPSSNTNKPGSKSNNTGNKKKNNKISTNNTPLVYDPVSKTYIKLDNPYKKLNSKRESKYIGFLNNNNKSKGTTLSTEQTLKTPKSPGSQLVSNTGSSSLLGNTTSSIGSNKRLNNMSRINTSGINKRNNKNKENMSNANSNTKGQNIQLTSNNLKSNGNSNNVSGSNNNSKEGILPSVNNIKETVSDTLFSKKVLYIILYIVILSILFIALYMLGNYLIRKYMNSGISVSLLDGVKKASEAYVITQDPLSRSYIPINRSDGQNGVQFSYSLWIYIENVNSSIEEKQSVFHKGNVDGYPLMCPAVFLHSNTLKIHINTLEQIDENLEIPEIPIRKWLHLTLVVDNKNMDVYINGYLKDRKVLTSLPKQNTGNFWCNMNGGFDGYVSRIKYYPYAVGLNDIISTVEEGPAKSACISTGDRPPYLDRSWFSI
jgi:hypothetical protein